jgi:AcrR family transcriptional regulator
MSPRHSPGAAPGAARARPTRPTRKRRAASDSDDKDTRQRVIDAAIRCILEQGFYRASSNAIAETAGLSWGVIQYYFGSREALMLAVLEEGQRRLTDDLSRAQITGETMPERLEQYFSVLEGYYGQPEYLAFIQVLLNLSHDPRTSDQTVESMTGATSGIDAELERLTKQLFAGTRARRAALRNFPFYVLRGMALSEVMLRTLPYDTSEMVKRLAEQRRFLTRAVTLLLESEGVEIGPGP